MGDKAGSVLTVVIVGVGTCLIGFLPTYQQIGCWAPLQLMVLRVVQRIGRGSEYAGANLITIEHAPRSKRGFWGSLPQTASPDGLLLAAGIFGLVSLLPHASFLAWGWRVPLLYPNRFDRPHATSGDPRRVCAATARSPNLASAPHPGARGGSAGDQGLAGMLHDRWRCRLAA